VGPSARVAPAAPHEAEDASEHLPVDLEAWQKALQILDGLDENGLGYRGTSASEAAELQDRYRLV
jgi:hypothetical protein